MSAENAMDRYRSDRKFRQLVNRIATYLDTKEGCSPRELVEAVALAYSIHRRREVEDAGEVCRVPGLQGDPQE